MARKRRLKPYEAVAFTNDLGQVIQPNDDIIIVTKCTGSVSVNVGKYLGLRRHSEYNGEENQNVVVEYDLVREETCHNVTNELWNYLYEPKDVPRPVHPEYRRLPWNASAEERRKANDEYAVARDNYSQACNAWHKAIEDYKKANYHDVEVSYKQCRTLQCNMIYPINMKFRELAA